MQNEPLGGAIECILAHGVASGLVPQLDAGYTRNLILDTLRLETPPPISEESLKLSINSSLNCLSDYAVRHEFIADLPSERERLETRIMGLLTPSPEAFRRTFENTEKSDGITKACAYFNSMCIANGYINEQALSRNVRFFAPSKYGSLEITINLSKPEKDPREIAALLARKNDSEYPPCMLCPENEGYAGRLGFPARQTLRTLPVTLCGEPWHFQYSPYRYFPEHCIVFSERHAPMKIEHMTFRRLLDFLTRFPHYMIGSNADLPIVGGSVLNHNHFQGGEHVFAMDKSDAIAKATHPMYPRVRVHALSWAMSTIRLTSEDRESLASLAELIRAAWSKYSDAVLNIVSSTDGTPHNTITPIARKTNAGFKLDLILRNNRTTKEHPLGIFHPHADLHHIKKENIGLIEAMGMFILPGRLLTQLDSIKNHLMSGREFVPHEESNTMSMHNDWIAELTKRYGRSQTEDSAEQIVRDALTEKCVRVLEDAAVFKPNENGKRGIIRFLESAGFIVI
ncbi:MAG: UDP-glucose--hexose-1-phosphate uridylyltransferase [Oscillospiraceae bacterium]|nr:UDP-glucose--hexose-1-phosphate uridylyltransferase [Oscillospiraceae bacterium]